MSGRGETTLDAFAQRELPPGGPPLRVVRGRLDAYWVSAARRRLIAIVEEGQHVFPADASAPGRIVLVSSEGAALVEDPEGLGSSARHWFADHFAFEPPPDEEATLPAVREAMAGFDAHFAKVEARQARRLQDRLVARRLDSHEASEDWRAELAWLAAALGCEHGDAKLPADVSFDALAPIVRLAGLRARRIELESRWPAREGLPMLLHRNDGAIVGVRWKRGAWRRRSGEAIALDDRGAYARTAWSLHPAFTRTVRGLFDLGRFIMPDVVVGAPVFLAGSVVLACLGLLVPLATAAIFDDFVPAGATGQLVGVGIALVAAALFATLFSAVNALALARIDAKSEMRLAAALADHVLSLPTSLFRDLPAGDINQRLESVEQMRGLVSSIILSTSFTAIMAIVYFALLYSYDASLALVAVALSLVSIALVFVGRLLQIGPLREAAALDGKVASMTYELLEAVPKLRTGCAEKRGLARWREAYVAGQLASVRGERVARTVGIVAQAYAIATLMVLFAAANRFADAGIAPGTFIAFLAGFGMFQATLIGLCSSLLGLLAAQPLAERAAVVLEAETERARGAGDPGRLSGRIDVSAVTFAYGKDAPPVLDGLDLRVEPGEHVAIVGGSGSGKSTLLRLLLGFETPRVGSIAYDGQEIAHLDLVRMRAQIGVVLQGSMLFAGSILENIRGPSDASLEDCLDAAEAAGLGPDLAMMGMGIHTPVTEGGGMFSGGQKQRMLIARALAKKPRILFFDEATSALDNATQARVAQTLDSLDATRVTIAHRLSTVRNATRICVLKDGRFVEQGAFDDLMKRNGHFAALARRQLMGG
ncbi:hypothetical protein B2G71_10340 [Novosphingobium sp. PC22D]|uniref:ATP-binding cassette domain-containing protein n=1 Tax=Novosphingobium sp. PC22D TaxID=1962403 RepID=UPI000BF0F3AF|nr:ATP-binding cassette domain-containing protein [Novosphingobium sp. PC22D]PEQ12696.1 hypothetical protein B2G71_10340 [Novosphingobium sp. PC22D]